MNPLVILGAAAAVVWIVNEARDINKPLGEWNRETLPSLEHIPEEGIDIPFELIKENPVLPIRLDGDDYLTCWILDSGYGFSAVDKRLAKRLNLPNDGNLAVQTLKTDQLISTRVPTGWVYDRETETPDLEVPVHRAVIRDLPYTLESTHGPSKSCLRPGGILGITFLRHFVTRLDYANRRLRFYDPRTFKYSGTGGYKYTGWIDRENYFIIPMKMDGVTANMALDTGAFANIMTRGFMEKYKRKTGRDFGESGLGGTVTASFSENVMDLRRKRVGKVKLADYTFPNLEVLFPEDETPGLLNTRRFDGLLGFPVLKNFTIYLVYEPTPYVILEPNNL